MAVQIEDGPFIAEAGGSKGNVTPLSWSRVPSLRASGVGHARASKFFHGVDPWRCSPWSQFGGLDAAPFGVPPACHLRVPLAARLRFSPQRKLREKKKPPERRLSERERRDSNPRPPA